MRSATPRPPLGTALVALQIPEFRRFFVAALVSNSGAWLQGLATPFVMFEITGSGAWVGVSVFSLMAPMALMGPLAGPLADRVPRRNILIVTQLCLAIIACVYAILWWTGVREPLAYVGTSILYGAANGFNMPAWQAYVSDLVPREALMNAITLNSMQFNAARAVGPSLGGVMLATLGPGWSFTGNALSFAAVLGALFTLPPGRAGAAGTRERPLRQFAQGMQYARTQPGIITGYIVAGVMAFLGGTLAQVHLVLFAEQVFEVGELWFGVLVSAFGVGGILVTPWLAASAPRYPKSVVLVAGLATYGVAELVLVSTTVYAVGVIGVVMAGAAHLTTATTSNTTIQLLVDEALRGRVVAMYLMVFTMGMPIGAIIQGPLADATSPRIVVLAMGIAMLSVAAWLVLSGRYRTFDPLPDAVG